MFRQFRAAIRLQLMFTAAAAMAGGWAAGFHGAVSASLGGLIGIAGGAVFALVATKSKSKSAGEVLGVALKAEGAKLSLMIVLLVLVLAFYRSAVAIALIGSFVVSALIFGIGAFAGDSRTHTVQKV